MFFYTFMPKLFNMSLTASVAIVLTRFISTMDKIKIRQTPVSQNRSEDRSQSFAIIVDKKLSLYFNEDFSEIWIDDGVKPSFSYPVANPETAEELLLVFNTAAGRGGEGIDPVMFTG